MSLELNIPTVEDPGFASEDESSRPSSPGTRRSSFTASPVGSARQFPSFGPVYPAPSMASMVTMAVPMYGHIPVVLPSPLTAKIEELTRECESLPDIKSLVMTLAYRVEALESQVLLLQRLCPCTREPSSSFTDCPASPNTPPSPGTEHGSVGPISPSSAEATVDRPHSRVKVSPRRSASERSLTQA